MFHTAQMLLFKFQEFLFIHTRGKDLFVADIIGRLFTKKELHLNQLNHQQLHPQNHCSTVTHDNQIERVH